MKTTVLSISFLAACFAWMPTKAYELATHGALTEKAYERSILTTDMQLLKDLGIDASKADVFGEVYYDLSGSNIRERTQNNFEKDKMSNEGKDFLTVKGWLMRGAIREDDLGTAFGINVGDDPHDDPYGNIFRVLNHFYDPALNRPLTVTGVLGETAPNWALGSQDAFGNPLQPNFNRRNHFTTLDAREAMYRALTGKSSSNQEVASTKEQRDRYWATTFRALGDVLHLNQDMAQPQHTRNDPHSGVPAFGDSSVFELYVDARATSAPQFKIDGTKVIPAPLLYEGFPIPTFTKYSDFWSTSPGAGSVTGNGLADYSNRSFFSAGTNLGSNGYTLPSNSAASYVKESAAGLIPELPLRRVNFLRGGQDNIRMTTEGLFDFFLVSTPPTYGLNRFNYDDQASLLIPRAVAYSAGLINYFFRGRLAAEDVEFTDTGVRLRVKNAIDAQQTPAWKDEILYATNTSGERGLFVLAYDYKDANGTKQYGASQPAPAKAAAEGGGDLAPGTTSNATYDFAVAIPDDAREVNYRLVFRGKLGQEEDAVAVGTVEPVSGFLINPNYVPADGVRGKRMIFRQGGQWWLSDAAGLESGNVDWKGWFVRGRPTKVLSWRGHMKRYFPEGSNRGISDFGPQIYQNGTLWSVAPRAVLGAAITKDGNGIAWIVAICSDGVRDFVYRRPDTKNPLPALFDPVTAPEGWEQIAVLDALPNVLGPDRGWFFNGTGTQAQTMRQSSSPSKLTRLKISIRGTSATITDLGNSPGHITAYSIDDPGWTGIPTQCVLSQTGTANRISRERWTAAGDDYVIAVDYRDQQEVLANIVYDGVAQRVRDRMADWQVSFCPGAGQIQSKVVEHESLSASSTIQATLHFGNLSIPLSPRAQSVQTSIVWKEVLGISCWECFLNGNFQESGQGKFTSDAESILLSFLDLRHDLYAGNEVVSTVGGGTIVTPTQICTSREGDELTLRDVVFYKEKLIASEQTFPASGSFCRNRENSEAIVIGASFFPLIPPSANPTPPAIPLQSLRGSWVVDTSGNLLVSQDKKLGAFDSFNYLTGGNLSEVVPVAPSGIAKHFPAGVVR